MSTALQHRHRRRLVNSWGRMEGQRLLEIGCGQGDTTEVLAEAVGSAGHVLAVDSAPPTYGSPQTLGEASDAIKASRYGERVEFLFEFDLLNAGDLGEFDGAVLAMSSWYFASEEELRATLERLKRLAGRLYFAEWDLTPTALEQVPHMLAALIQARAGGATNEGNIRTLLTRSQLVDLVRASGWRIEKVETVAAGDLEDADWEVTNCRRLTVRPGMEAELSLLAQMAKEKGNGSLDTFAIVAAC